MNVRNRIDAFEAHNEVLRRSSALSPKSPNAVSPHISPRPPMFAGSPPPSTYGAAPLSPIRTHVSPDDRPASETSMASQSRISRLQRQQSGGSGEMDARRKNQRQTRRLMGVPEPAADQALHRSDVANNQSSAGPGASLFSHRKPDVEVAASPATTASGQSSQYAGKSSLSRRATEVSRRRMLMQPRLNHDEIDDRTSVSRSKRPQSSYSNHPSQQQHQRMMKEAPPSSVGNSRLIKMQRIKKMRNLDRQKSRDGVLMSSSQDNASLHQSSSAEAANDDDITLTSVRQIVGSPSVMSSPSSSVKNVPDDEKDDHMLSRHGETSNLKWIQDGEEKSAKAHTTGRRIVMARSSSSEYETDGDRSQDPRSTRNQVMNGPSTSASQMTPDVAAFFDRRRRNGSPREDDDTEDYSCRDDDNNTHGNHTFFESAKDDDSQGSMSYSRRLKKEAKEREEEARKKAAAAAKAGTENPFFKAGFDNPFLPKEKVDEFRKQYDTPGARTAVGVAAASTLGFVILGPVGLLVGAATAGIGAGIMQIPEEQRSNMCVKASEAVHGAQQTAIICTEALSNSCANTYENSVADHVPAEMKSCCTAIDEEVTKVVSSSQGLDTDSILMDPGGLENTNRIEPQGNKSKDGKPNISPKRLRNKKDNVACLREGKIIPVSQIHALDPSSQPRAWLDVLASAATHHDEKTEAMEEILILAKDKQRARVFLEEGILDSIMWTLGRYLEKVEYNKAPSGAWQTPGITREEETAAKLAATCCLTLGKSHCAAIHTGGDLLLMSMYERGTVPEERQLAQMLHEVSFHTRIMKTDDPTLVDPRNEVFVMKQLSLPQAEELAQKVKAVADGKV